jgi:hypothetical protein
MGSFDGSSAVDELKIKEGMETLEGVNAHRDLYGMAEILPAYLKLVWHEGLWEAACLIQIVFIECWILAGRLTRRLTRNRDLPA